METTALKKITPADFSNLVNQADCGLLIFSNCSQTTLAYANPYFFSLFGYTEEEFREKFENRFFPCIYGEDGQKFKSILARQFAMGNTLNFEFRALRKDRSLTWILLRGRLHQEENASFYYCSCLDITDIKVSYDNLAKTKLESDIIANNIGGGILKACLTNYKILYANDGFYELSGISRSEYEKLYHNICTGIIYPEDKATVNKMVQKSIATRCPLTIEYRIIHKTGEIRWSYLNGNLIDDIDGAPVYLCVIIDITKLKQYEAQLTEQQKKQQLLNSFTNEISWEYDIARELITRSGRSDSPGSPATRIPPFSREAFLNSYLHPEDRGKFIAALNPKDPSHNFIKMTVRIKNHLQNYMWYLVQGITLYDDLQKPYKVIGKTTLIETAPPAQTESAPSYVTWQELETYSSSSLENPAQMKQCALYVVFLNERDAIKKKYGSFFYQALQNEIAAQIDTIFTSAMKCRTEDDEFLIFITNAFSIESVNRKALKLTNALHASFFETDSFCPVKYQIGSYIAGSEAGCLDLLYKKVKESLAAEMPSDEAEQAEDCVPAIERGPRFLTDTIRCLDGVEDNPAAFKLALSSICNFFNADQICLFEANPDHSQITMTNNWSIPGSPDRIDTRIFFTRSQMLHYETLFDKEGIFVCPNLSLLKEPYPYIYEQLSNTNLHSMLESALYHKGEYMGFISINYCQTAQKWTTVEIEYLKILTHFISLSLIRSRVLASPANAATYDHVTGLVTFDQFVETANQFLQKERDASVRYALLYMDIDHFMQLNNRYGFTTGNKVLKYLCHSIVKHLTPDELCCRIQGDRFVIFVNYQEKEDLTKRLAEFNQDRLSQQTKLEEYYQFSISCGFYLIKDEDRDITAVIDKADFARQSIKSMTGPYNFAFYSNAMEQWSIKENELLVSLQTAFKNHEFLPYYQPQYWLQTEELYALEALARWNRPGSSRVLYPPEFFPLLEKSLQVIELDYFIIEESLKRLHMWISQNDALVKANQSAKCKKIVPISVNISGFHLGTTNFTERLLQLREKYQIPSKYLILEFTESLFIKEPEPLYSLLKELDHHGFPITVDNFGKEYSSLGLFKRFPISIIKFDSGFFYGKIADKKDKILFKKIIEIAKEMNITVVSVNIESPLQINQLRELGCEVVQGALFHKAMPVEELEKYVL